MSQMENASPPAFKPVSPADATKRPVIPDPKVIVGLAIMTFGGWLAFEGIMIPSIGQFAIAIIFFFGGWWLRKRGIADSDKVCVRHWISFCALAIPVLLVAYIAGYFVLMDRHQPTFPTASSVRFESTVRWAPYEWVNKAKPPYQTKWKSVTTWNILYRPMDRIWFRFFPRSQEEIEKLREMGYYRN